MTQNYYRDLLIEIIRDLFTVDSETLGTAVTQVHCRAKKALCFIFAVVY